MAVYFFVFSPSSTMRPSCIASKAVTSGEIRAIACSARVDAVAPTGGMAVVTVAWGMPVAVMVQVRVRT